MRTEGENMPEMDTGAEGRLGSTSDSRRRSRERKDRRGPVRLLQKLKKLREGNLLLIILAICVAMSFLSPVFLTSGNIRAFLLSFATDGIVVVGMTLMLIVGGIDLSVGSVLCFSGIHARTLFNWA